MTGYLIPSSYGCLVGLRGVCAFGKLVLQIRKTSSKGRGTDEIFDRHWLFCFALLGVSHPSRNAQRAGGGEPARRNSRCRKSPPGQRAATEEEVALRELFGEPLNEVPDM